MGLLYRPWAMPCHYFLIFAIDFCHDNFNRLWVILPLLNQSFFIKFIKFLNVYSLYLIIMKKYPKCKQHNGNFNITLWFIFLLLFFREQIDRFIFFTLTCGKNWIFARHDFSIFADLFATVWQKCPNPIFNAENLKFEKKLLS